MKVLKLATLIELIWTITPAVILILIAFPSFKCAPRETNQIRGKTLSASWSCNKDRRSTIRRCWALCIGTWEPNKTQRIIADTKSLLRSWLPRVEEMVSVKNTPRITNSKHSLTEHRRSVNPKQNMSVYDIQLAIADSLSFNGSPEGYGRWYASYTSKVSEGLNSLTNDLIRSPRDQTAYVITRGDGTSIVANKAKGGSLGFSRLLHSSHNKDLSKPKLVRKDISVGAWLRRELDENTNVRNKFTKVIKILANPLYLVACYEIIKGKPGNMTPGSDINKMTLDGISNQWFLDTAEMIAKGQYKFTPSRVQEIPKANGKMRILKINDPREKIVQKAIELILRTIWEPLFHDTSHGFRPNRSTKTALKVLMLKGDDFAWAIQGDISKCFDNIPHEIILNNLRKEIMCEPFIRVIGNMIGCGSRDENSKIVTYSNKGTPQGNVASPTLANIVLNNLDGYLESYKLKFEIGKKRALSKEYVSLRNKRAYTKDPLQKRILLQQMLKTSSVNRMDPNFKRLLYIRYADDFLILVTGSYQDVLHIKRHVKDYLKTHTGLELNEEKTTISPTSNPFIFLGASCKRVENSTKLSRISRSNIRKRTTPRMRVDIPMDILVRKLVNNRFVKFNKLGTVIPTSRKDLVNLDHNDIIRFYNSKIQGTVSHYGYARNRYELHRIGWYYKASCASTLALKYKLRTMRATFSKFGPFLASTDNLKLNIPTSFKQLLDFNTRREDAENISEIIKGSWAAKTTGSNLFKSCLICGSNKKVEMHHIRTVKDVRAKWRSGNRTFEQWAGSVNRKQVPLCAYHHDCLHGERLNYQDMKRIAEFKD